MPTRYFGELPGIPVGTAWGLSQWHRVEVHTRGHGGAEHRLAPAAVASPELVSLTSTASPGAKAFSDGSCGEEKHEG